MDFSFLKALAATVRGQVSSLKSQTKRLQAASLEVFGQPYPIEVCRTAVAIANGYRNWGEVQNLANNVGQDRTLPAWHIKTRSDAHQACLMALVETDVEMSDSFPVVVLGDCEHAAIPAVCLWIEQISMRKVPGVIVIDTTEVTFQKTHLGVAVKALGLKDLVHRFRVIDARGPCVPLAMTATPMQWTRGISEAFSDEQWQLLEDSNVRVHFEYLIAALHQERSGERNGEELGPYLLDTVCSILQNPSFVRSHLPDLATAKDAISDYLHNRFEQDAARFPREALEAFTRVVLATRDRLSDVGVLLSKEALHRPTVVLCNGDDPVSMVVASLVRGMYYDRFVSERSIRPLLYCGAPDRKTLPKMLHFGAETVLFTGERDMRSPIWNSYRTKCPVFVTADSDSIVVSGKLASLLPGLSD